MGGVILVHSAKLVFIWLKEPSTMGTDIKNSSGRSTFIIAIIDIYIMTKNIKPP